MQPRNTSEAVTASGCAQKEPKRSSTRPATKATIDARSLLVNAGNAQVGYPLLTGETARLSPTLERAQWARLADEVWRRTRPRADLSPEWKGVVVDSGDDWATIEYPYEVVLWEIDDPPMLTIIYPTWALSLCEEGGVKMGASFCAAMGGSEKDFRLKRLRRLLTR